MCQHHDIELLPSWNILMLAWERFTTAEAMAASCNPATLGSGELWAKHIIEVAPTGTYGGSIEWEWRGWSYVCPIGNSGRITQGSAIFGNTAFRPACWYTAPFKEPTSPR